MTVFGSQKASTGNAHTAMRSIEAASASVPTIWRDAPRPSPTVNRSRPASSGSPTHPFHSGGGAGSDLMSRWPLRPTEAPWPEAVSDSRRAARAAHAELAVRIDRENQASAVEASHQAAVQRLRDRHAELQASALRELETRRLNATAAWQQAGRAILVCEEQQAALNRHREARQQFDAAAVLEDLSAPSATAEILEAALEQANADYAAAHQAALAASRSSQGLARALQEAVEAWRDHEPSLNRHADAAQRATAAATAARKAHRELALRATRVATVQEAAHLADMRVRDQTAALAAADQKVAALQRELQASGGPRRALAACQAAVADVERRLQLAQQSSSPASTRPWTQQDETPWSPAVPALNALSQQWAAARAALHQAARTLREQEQFHAEAQAQQRAARDTLEAAQAQQAAAVLARIAAIDGREAMALEAIGPADLQALRETASRNASQRTADRALAAIERALELLVARQATERSAE